MSIPGAANPLLFGGGGVATQQVSRSLRARASASAYMSKAYAINGNYNTWTISMWVKRGRTGYTSYLFEAGTTFITGGYFNSDQVAFQAGNLSSASYTLQPTAYLKDSSAWYHLMFVCNTTSATSTLTGTTSDRLQVWINGVQTSSFVTANVPTQNSNLPFAVTGVTQYLFRNGNNTTQYFDGEIAEFYYVDGLALTASSFGATNSVLGMWQPKQYTGSFGSAGFYLPFTNTTSTTTLGNDSSGNGNNWTPSGFSLTAGVTYDSMIDTPSPYSDASTYYNRGNYCTLNSVSYGDNLTVTAANTLVGSVGATSWGIAPATMAAFSGSYWEVTIGVAGSVGNHQHGLSSAGATLNNYLGVDTKGWAITTSAGIQYKVYNNNSASAAISGAPTTAMAAGDVWMFAFKNNKMYWGLNGTWYPTGANPATETSPVATTLPNEVFPTGSCVSSATAYFNFGQRPFIYTPPSGFLAINSYNMSAGSVTASGTFTGNALLTNTPFVYLNGAPSVMSINGNAVTWGTHAYKEANGFKINTNSASYNAAGSNTYSVTSTGPKLKYGLGQTT